VGSQTAVTDARQFAAERAAAGIVERQERGEIAAAIAHTLDVCGAGCTDISTARIVSDAILLRRVLVLYELDKAARAPAHQAVQGTPSAVNRTR